MPSWLKSQMSSIRDKIGSRILPPGVVWELNRNDREGALHRAWGHVFTSQIKGAYYEFGVYRGETFRKSYQVWQRYSKWQSRQLIEEEAWRREAAKSYADFKSGFYAFDSFKGIPENNEGNVTFDKGAFAFQFEDFERLNQAAGLVEGDDLKYFQGFFSEIMTNQGNDLMELQPAAIINLDCDLYSSARDALNIVGPKLIQGSVILADDWNTFAADRKSGERKALSEFLEEHSDIDFETWFTYQHVGQAFIVHRNA